MRGDNDAHTNLLLALTVLALLAGCQTWGPTWSEITGERFNRGDRATGGRRSSSRSTGSGSFADRPDRGRAGHAPDRAGSAAAAGPAAAPLVIRCSTSSPASATTSTRSSQNTISAGLDAGRRLRRGHRRLHGRRAK